MVTGWIKKLVSGPGPQDQGAVQSTLAPSERFYVVGDIHGRLDLLQRLLATLDADCPIIFVGDYVDRGEYSAQVLRHLRHLGTNADRRVTCLMGNHEDMLLRFLDDPEGMARMWWHNGGQQTLASYGIATSADEAFQIADKLRSAMGQPMLDWLRDLPLRWTSGNVTVVHAALDPARPVDEQTERTCLWGHPHFPSQRRRDGHWVVHGHTIVTDPRIENRVISVDTGAFATNHLTAAEISPGQVRFLFTDRHGVSRL